MILKFFTPIYGELKYTDDEGKVQCKNVYSMANYAFSQFYKNILTEMEAFNKNLTKKGLMEHVKNDDEIAKIIKSAVPSIKAMEFDTYAVMSVEVDDSYKLTKDVMNKIKSFIIDQYKNGWGKEFGKQSIEVIWDNPAAFDETISGTINLRFWDEEDFFIKPLREVNKRLYIRMNSEISEIKENYPEGTEMELVKDLPQYEEMRKGLRGKVKYIDQHGFIVVEWDNGKLFGVMDDEDCFRKIEPPSIHEETAPTMGM